MTLNALAAALQGIGFGSFLTALQGLFAVTIIPAPRPIEASGGHAVFRTRRRRIALLLPDEWADGQRHHEDEEALLLALGAL